jgi:hypothetical protein
MSRAPFSRASEALIGQGDRFRGGAGWDRPNVDPSGQDDRCERSTRLLATEMGRSRWTNPPNRSVRAIASNDRPAHGLAAHGLAAHARAARRRGSR